MKVKALKRGFWPHNRERQPGEAFDYDGPTQKVVAGKKVPYFPSWMQKLEADKPKADPEKEAAEKAAAAKPGE